MITLYSKPACLQCDATKIILEQNNISYKEELITTIENLALVKSWGFMQAPVINAGNGNRWSGFRPEKLAELT